MKLVVFVVVIELLINLIFEVDDFVNGNVDIVVAVPQESSLLIKNIVPRCVTGNYWSSMF